MRPLYVLALSFVSCGAGPRPPSDMEVAPVPAAGPGQAVAVVAGGCFWCIESDFDKLPGVLATTSGFAGGSVPNPTYAQVANHQTDHIEALHVVYDTSKLTYGQVLDWFWRHVDPTDAGGQFCDRGDTYRTAIFPLDDAQRAEAAASKSALEARRVLPGPVVTEIIPIERFWAAEVYHQDFHTKEPLRYQTYRQGCRRDARVGEVWAKDAAPPPAP